MPVPRRSHPPPNVSKMVRLIADLQADNARMRERLALLETPPHFVPLKTLLFEGGPHIETIRRWCAADLVRSETKGGKLFVDDGSCGAKF
jgi:hypothetical protein